MCGLAVHKLSVHIEMYAFSLIMMTCNILMLFPHHIIDSFYEWEQVFTLFLVGKCN